MSVQTFNDENIIALHTKNSTYQLMKDDYGHLLHLYFGNPNPYPAKDQVAIKPHAFSGNPYYAKNQRGISLDILPQEYPTLGTGDYRKPALIVEDENGTQASQLFVKEIRIDKEKPLLENLPSLSHPEAEKVEILLEDPVLMLEVRLVYGVFEDLDIFTRSVSIKNASSKPLVLKKVMSFASDYLHGDFDVLYFQGRHAMERKLERKTVEHGIFSIRSNRGASSHHYNPACILAKPETTEDFGDCYGFAYAWSGNFLIEIEKDYLDQTRVLIGLDDENFAYPLRPGQSFQGPEVIFSFSSQGLSRLSQNYHHMFQYYGSPNSFRPDRRPVLLNSWEASYFDFNHDSFMNLARQAKKLGMDTIVLDDGWFGDRQDETSSLGDWYENEEKLGGTLKDLSSQVHKLGLNFGLWMEPEMISENSALYNEHKDWIIRIANRAPNVSRNQLVLDFSRQEVVDHIFEQLSKVLDQAKVDYVKWDMNRSVSDFANGSQAYDYMLGVYQLLDRLQKRYPEVLFEGCAGGGGRFDLGMLYYTPQIWASDNTDPINRIDIQYGTSFFYPMSAMAAHVSSSPNHQTGRNTSMDTRAAVAMQGVFGYELDLNTLEEQEKDKIPDQIEFYRQVEPLIHKGEFYRLSNPLKESVGSWMFVSADQREAFISLIPLKIEPSHAPIYLPLKGLRSDWKYTDQLSGKSFYGSNLLQDGLVVPDYRQYEAIQLHLKAEEQEEK